jgi:hypothetical protein
MYIIRTREESVGKRHDNHKYNRPNIVIEQTRANAENKQREKRSPNAYIISIVLYNRYDIKLPQNIREDQELFRDQHNELRQSSSNEVKHLEQGLIMLI